MPDVPPIGARSGKLLNPLACARGWRRELDEMVGQGVFLVIPLSAAPRDAKRIGGKWVEDEKTSEEDVKSRFCATEVAHGVREDVHAGTPGMKAVRLLLAMAALRRHQVGHQ